VTTTLGGLDLVPATEEPQKAKDYEYENCPIFDDGARAQVEQVRAPRTPDLQGLLRGKDTWTVTR
jgi:hypothetical protein